MSTTVTLIGKLGADPELRFTNSGKAVVALSLVTSKPVKGDDGKWKDEETTWWRVTCWDSLAENAAETLQKGDAVIVHGRTFTESYTTKEGEERTSLKVNAYNIGPALKRVSAKLNRGERVAVKQVEDDPWNSGGDAPF